MNHRGLGNSGLSYRASRIEALENRELLAADLPLGANLVENGQFESLEGTFAADWNVGQQPLPTHDFAARPERGQVAVVAAGASATQSLDVVAGQTYLLTFDFRLAGESQQGTLEVNPGESRWSATQQWQTGKLVIEAQSNRLDVTFTSADAIFLDQVRLAAVEPMNLVNGDFEDLPADVDQVFQGKELPGWNLVGDDPAGNLNVRRSEAADGGWHLNVDGNTDWLDRIFREMETRAGETYFVGFDIWSPVEGSREDGEMRARWNDQFAGAFFGHGEWQTVGFYATGDSDLSRLVFREPGEDGGTGDGQGPYVDNVRMYRVVTERAALAVSDAASLEPEFVEGNEPVRVVSDGLELTSSLGDELTGAVVKIRNRQDAPFAERLAVDVAGTSIQASFDETNSRLRLSGRASLAAYESVLETLTYENLSEAPDETPREIRVTIDLDDMLSLPHLVTVKVNGVNDRPVIANLADQSVTVLTPLVRSVNATDAETPGELTYSVRAFGTAVGVDDILPTISNEGVVEWTPQRSGQAEIRVTVRDPEGLQTSRTFTVTAELDADVPEDFAPFAGQRQLSNVTPIQRDGIYDSLPPLNLDPSKEYRAILETDGGDIELLLYSDDTPVTVNSFVNLARDGFYDGLTFFRVQSLIDSSTAGFIAQAGDPRNSGRGGPGYNFDDENLGSSIFSKPVIAMANRGAGTFSNGSQFFLTYDDQVTHLNGGHTIFGEIVGGLDALNAIQKRLPDSGIPATVIRTVKILEL